MTPPLNTSYILAFSQLIQMTFQVYFAEWKLFNIFFIPIWLKFVPKGSTDNKSALIDVI